MNKCGMKLGDVWKKEMKCEEKERKRKREDRKNGKKGIFDENERWRRERYNRNERMTKRDRKKKR